MLTELVDQKVVYEELITPKYIELYKSYLKSDNVSTKANLYILLTTIVSKYKANEHSQKKANGNTYDDCAEDIVIEDDEEMMMYKEKDNEDNELLNFLKYAVKEDVSNELTIPQDEA